MSYQMITANRLKDGAVVYLDAHKEWTRQVNQGEALKNATAESRMPIAQQAVDDQIVVAPYLIEVQIADDRITPIRYREIIRADGPTA